MGIMAKLTGVSLEDLGPLSLEASDGGVSVSSVCVVFARSEVLAYLRSGVSKSEVLAGAGQALCPLAVLDHLQAELRHLAAHRLRRRADHEVDALAPGGQGDLGSPAHQCDAFDPEQLLGRAHPARPARCEDDCGDASHGL